jgi:small subunit ribosomal protein S21
VSEIRLSPGESIESALRRFKKATQKEGLTTDMRRLEHYIGPSEKRRKKSAAARKRLAK